MRDSQPAHCRRPDQTGRFNYAGVVWTDALPRDAVFRRKYPQQYHAVVFRVWTWFCRSAPLAALVMALGLPSVQANAGTARHQTDWIGQTGVASYYGARHQGRRTASGAPFNKNALTAAHPWLPFGTKVRVTVERTGRSVVVTITDRLPFGKRIIDLSRHAAQVLGIVHQGLAEVSLDPTS